jgi:hypothetical protein
MDRLLEKRQMLEANLKIIGKVAVLDERSFGMRAHMIKPRWVVPADKQESLVEISHTRLHIGWAKIDCNAALGMLADVAFERKVNGYSYLFIKTGLVANALNCERPLRSVASSL